MPDAIVVGAGHNGLVAASYLARAGHSVLVLERLAEPGGAVAGGSPFTGHSDRLSRYSYLVSLFPQRIARDLGVRLELRDRRVAAYAEGRVFDTVPGIGVGDRLFDTLLEPLVAERTARSLMDDDTWVDRPLGQTLHERWDDPLVRGVVGTDGLIGTFASLDDPALRQNRCFLWHVIGGPWRVPVGGMGALAAELTRAAVGAGADVRCGAEVEHVDPDAGEVTWSDGEGVEHAATARWILDSRPDPDAHVAEGSQMKLNMLLDRLPRLRAGVDPADAFAGTFRVNERDDELEDAYAQAARGELPDRPPAELYCHSLTDRSIMAPDAPPERHTLTLFGLHTPASLFAGDDNDAGRAAMTERYLDALDRQLAEPIRDCLARDADGELCVEAKTPVDLERDLRLPRGNIFHGDLAWPWAETPEDVGTWGAETGHPRVFRCGASARRGGGVSGVAGHNAAMAVLERARGPRV